MGEHYCCKRCGQEYYSCVCAPLPPPATHAALEDVVTKAVGAELAALVDDGSVLRFLAEATDESSGVEVTPHDVAVARALLARVSGSALLDGDKKALGDAYTLYRMVNAASALLVGRVKT